MNTYRILVKGIVKKDDKYLIVERWYDDRIISPYQWEFIDGRLNPEEGPDQAVCRIIEESVGLSVQIDKILYTWSFQIGDVNNIGIAYLCLTAMEEICLSEELHDYKWITREEFNEYIENSLILQDIDRAEL